MQSDDPLHLIVPEEALIEIGTETIRFIGIGSEHSDEEHPLHITINGTVKWVDEACGECGFKLFQISDASHLTIDGTGTFTSELDPSESEQLPVAIRIIDESHDIVIRDLRFDHLGYAVQTGDGSLSNLEFDDLHAEEMSHYGIFCSSADGVYVHDCQVGDPLSSTIHGTYNDHAFRFYADNLTITDCIAHDISNFGCWPVSGENVYIDGFETDAPFGFGPNPSYAGSSADEHLYHTEIHDVTVTGTGITCVPNLACGEHACSIARRRR